jgi:hypothetical protein
MVFVLVFMVEDFMEDLITFITHIDGGILIPFILLLVLGFTTLFTTEDFTPMTGFITIVIIAMLTDINPKEDPIQIPEEEGIVQDVPLLPWEIHRFLQEKVEPLDPQISHQSEFHL